MLWLIASLAAFLAFSIFVLRGENLSYLDQPPPPAEATETGPAMRAVLEQLQEASARADGPSRGRMARLRKVMDEFGDGEFQSEFRPLNRGDVRGEWVLPSGYDGKRRLLYIHGGAFFAGSPLSHRPITDRLARLTGMAVFSLDYRLMPEHRRMEGIEDCRRAYEWIVDNGPDDPGVAEKIVVAGDSAGGNLTLALIAWLRDRGLRQADAAIAFSPATDAVLDAPSLRRNIPTDPMLGPAFGAMARIPTLLLLWLTWFNNRMRPADPRISPLRGSLHDLPPLLIQVSTTEMLLDDSRRYAARAQAAESPVVLQCWPGMVHVWQMFMDLPEAEEAYDNVAEFLEGALAA